MVVRLWSVGSVSVVVRLPKSVSLCIKAIARTCPAGRIISVSLFLSPANNALLCSPSYLTMVRSPQLSPLPVPEAHGKGGVRTPHRPRSLQRHPSPICRPLCESAAPPAPHLCLCTRCRGAVETWRRRYGRFFRRMSRCGSCSRSQPLGTRARSKGLESLCHPPFLRLRCFVVLPGAAP